MELLPIPICVFPFYFSAHVKVATIRVTITSCGLFVKLPVVWQLNLNSWIWWKLSRNRKDIWDRSQWFWWGEDICCENSLWGISNTRLEYSGTLLHIMESLWWIFCSIFLSVDISFSFSPSFCSWFLNYIFPLYLQEHTVLLITKLLSPPVPSDYSGSESHLIGYAPFLNVLLVGISSIDHVQIFSVHGVVGWASGSMQSFHLR